MDPLSALSIATGIVTFIDFGAKLVTLYIEIQKFDDGRTAALSALESESRELSGYSLHAQTNIAALKARYPRQAEALTRLTAHRRGFSELQLAQVHPSTGQLPHRTAVR
ncbi:hypothetical protein C8A05DRAFT_38884 [Staphylotrichum tortipilum]|uniref:Uncharacterized protein n=1 Tax=Staphylotrichum tortipilum TaxID=2831512 RepID=A0AAN6RP21_9PEZI|nr:hypothetical protein C8A05DRAFT_38884 [Staphylotrichum longicolle]